MIAAKQLVSSMVLFLFLLTSYAYAGTIIVNSTADTDTRGDDITLSSLGEQLKLDSGTLTPLLKRLEKSGLLRRLRDPEDERKVRVTLTPDGIALREQAQKVPGLAAAATGCEISELDDLTERITMLRDGIVRNLEP